MFINSDLLTDMPRYTVIRFFAGVLAGITALIYFLIGVNAVTVLDDNTSQLWALAPAVAYALGVYLLFEYDRRAVFVLGAILQIFVIYTYFDVSPERSPHYEVWGILLRIVQVIMLLALVYLAYHHAPAQTSEANRDV